MTGLDHTFDRARTSGDPNGAQFGHVVEQTGLADAEEYDAVLVGELYDRAAIGQRGAKEGPTSGTPYRQLFDAGPVDPAVVGARDFETSTACTDFLDGKGGTIVTPADVSRDLEAAAATAIDSVAGFEVI